jgi:hypothetical protein
VDSRTDLDAVAEEIKNSYPCRKSNPGRPVRSVVTTVTELSRIFKLKLEWRSLAQRFVKIVQFKS